MTSLTILLLQGFEQRSCYPAPVLVRHLPETADNISHDSITNLFGSQAEWWIAVGHQQECVGLHPQPPATDPDVEVKEAPRVSTGRQNSEPGYDQCEEAGNAEEKQDEIMRDHEQPLDQWIPPVEVSFYIGVINFQVDRLLVEGGRVSVREQACIGTDSGLEAGQLA
jgi:hypothetical protein